MQATESQAMESRCCCNSSASRNKNNGGNGGMAERMDGRNGGMADGYIRTIYGTQPTPTMTTTMMTTL